MSPHDAPSLEQLIEAVRDWLQRDVLTATSGRLQFHARVAINMLAIAERELSVGAAHHEAHQQRLQLLGFTDDAALSAAIRSGDVDDRMAQVRAAVWASVQDKLAVANPKYVSEE